jgi:Cu2+-exporting ATPase
MHPEITQSTPGTCPKCHMALERQKNASGHHPTDHSSEHHEHDEHAGHSVKMFKDKFWLSLLLTIPVVLYSEMIQQWFGFTPPMFPGSEYIPLIFSTIIFFYGGLVFIRGALGEIKAKLPGMMTLISIAIITAYLYSYATWPLA